MHPHLLKHNITVWSHDSAVLVMITRTSTGMLGLGKPALVLVENIQTRGLRCGQHCQLYKKKALTRE